MEVREGERGEERGMPVVPPSHTPLCTALGTPQIRVRPQHSPGLGFEVFVSHFLSISRIGLGGVCVPLPQHPQEWVLRCLCLTPSALPRTGF